MQGRDGLVVLRFRRLGRDALRVEVEGARASERAVVLSRAGIAAWIGDSAASGPGKPGTAGEGESRATEAHGSKPA